MQSHLYAACFVGGGEPWQLRANASRPSDDEVPIRKEGRVRSRNPMLTHARSIGQHLLAYGCWKRWSWRQISRARGLRGGANVELARALGRVIRIIPGRDGDTVVAEALVPCRERRAALRSSCGKRREPPLRGVAGAYQTGNDDTHRKPEA
jgi:hypothetical protein